VDSPRCWWCGVEPADETDVRFLGGTVEVIYTWPGGDHPHRISPPTPEQLQEEAYRLLVGRAV